MVKYILRKRNLIYYPTSPIYQTHLIFPNEDVKNINHKKNHWKLNGIKINENEDLNLFRILSLFLE